MVQLAAQVAFLGLDLLIAVCQAMIGGLHRFGHYRHHAKRTSDRTGFAADTFLLADLDAGITLFNGPGRTNIGTGRIFAMVAEHGRITMGALNNLDSWGEIFALAWVCPLMMRSHAGDLATPAANAGF
jgi:hypothetical protein